MKNLTLITGAVRSGKSQFAESLARASQRQVVYLATMAPLPGDAEQEQRIEKHRKRRPSSWTTIERPYNLVETITSLDADSAFCILDCLSVYLSNFLVQAGGDPYEEEEVIAAEIDALIQAIERRHQLHFAVVTNEVGWGVVPETPLGRAFRDFLGVANQHFAAHADEVWLTCVGLPVRLKPQ